MTDRPDETDRTPADEADEVIRRHRESVDEEVADLQHEGEELDREIEDVRREVRRAEDSDVLPAGETDPEE